MVCVAFDESKSPYGLAGHRAMIQDETIYARMCPVVLQGLRVNARVLIANIQSAAWFGYLTRRALSNQFPI